MGNTLVGGHGLHIFPFQPAEMIFYPHGFFKQATKFNRAQIDVPKSVIDFFEADLQTSTGG